MEPTFHCRSSRLTRLWLMDSKKKITIHPSFGQQLFLSPGAAQCGTPWANCSILQAFEVSHIGPKLLQWRPERSELCPSTATLDSNECHGLLNNSKVWPNNSNSPMRDNLHGLPATFGIVFKLCPLNIQDNTSTLPFISQNISCSNCAR